MAHMVNNSKLTLKSPEDDKDIPKVEIILAPPEDKKIRLESTTYSTPTYCSWLKGTCDEKLIERIKLSKDELQSISEWILPHRTW
jgi:hypothetical protein